MNPIEEIIEDFAGCADLDEDDDVIELLKELMEKCEDNLLNDVIKKTIYSELQALSKAIDEHKKQEFCVLPETFDAKYAHWFALQWIMSRHYRKQQPPKWYLYICDVIKKTNGQLGYCNDVITELTKFLEACESN